MISISNRTLDRLQPKPRTGHNFYKADYEKILEKLSDVDWSNQFLACNNNVDEMTAVFYNKLNMIIEELVPKLTPQKSRIRMVLKEIG